MSKKTYIALAALAGILLAIIIIYTLPVHWLVLPPEPHHAKNDSNQEYWACPMFCTRSDAPGTCPVCGMTLEKVQDTGTQLKLDSATRQALSLTTEKATYRFLAKEIRTVGMFYPDETTEETISAWVDGRIEHMHAGYTGESVEIGQPLIDLYSPDLFIAQKELILAKEYAELLDLARDKARFLGIPNTLIREIETWKTPKDTLTIPSQADGIVLESNVSEGDYVKEGQPLLKIADLRHLWLLLDIHERNIPWLALGQKVVVQVDAFPGKQIYGKLSFIYPTLNPTTHTVQVRIEIANDDLSLRPGMFGTATILARLAEDGSVDKKPGRILSVPKQAVLSTGNRHFVYIEHEDFTYQGVEVILGPLASEWKKRADGTLVKHKDYFPVYSGLPPESQVVTNSQFLIDSQMELSGKPSLLRNKVQNEVQEVGHDPSHH